VLAEELDDIPGELVRGVDLRGARRDPLARDRPNEVPDLDLLVGERLPGHARIVTSGRVASVVDVTSPAQGA
jgi:hypothetical protein